MQEKVHIQVFCQNQLLISKIHVSQRLNKCNLDALEAGSSP